MTSNHADMCLWKGVEKLLPALRLCSGCAGDYEDPDWSAWEPDPPDSEADEGNPPEQSPPA